MIIAVLTPKGGAGKTTVALHLAGELERQGASVLLVDADPQGSALDWAEQRARDGRPRLFGIVGLARETLHREYRTWPGRSTMSSSMDRRVGRRWCARQCSQRDWS
jgi:cellulose biosynthesis protein BcsQ